MQDASNFFLSDCSDDSVDPDNTIHMIRCEARAKLRLLSDSVRILMDDGTFKDGMDKDYADLTILAGLCPGAEDRSDMLVMLADKIDRTQEMWWAAEWEYTNGLKKEMKAKWNELHNMGLARGKSDQGAFLKAGKNFGFAVATGADSVATSAAAFKDRSRSPPSRARTRDDEGLDFFDTLDPIQASDDDSQKTLALRGPRRESDAHSDH